MNPIRSNLPIPTARPQRPEARTAQQAFFQAAVNRAQIDRSEPVRPVAAATRAARDPLTEEEPSRYLRPGSLVDIKV